MARKPHGKAPLVISRHGSFRFRRGLVTATVLQLGLDMERALAASEALRDRLGGRGQVTTRELQDELWVLLKEKFDFTPPEPRAPEPPAKPIRTEEGVFPFSKGVLVRRMVAGGLQIEGALRVADEVAAEVNQLPEPEVMVEAVDAITERLLRVLYDEGHARRYRVITALRALERPVILLIGGAVGTGKSSVATELAYRLGIRKVTSTDMIRETMRTVLSAEVVPGLHDHSFRGILEGSQVLSDPRERVLAGFRQQAAQVAVGVRAVIRRAVREQTHMIIEGTHLLPPFTQLLPADAEAHLVGFVLSVQSRPEHQARFPARAAHEPQRGAEPYLDAFQSVRWIHDDILRLVEEHEAYVIENTDLPRTITAAVEYLSRILPIQDGHPGGLRPTMPVRPAIRTLMVIFDGLADEPNPALGGKTPLGAARTPTLRHLAGSGAQGLLATTPTGGEAHTDVGLLTLLSELPVRPRFGRGLFEALGIGLPLHAGSVLLRGNLATLADDGIIVDRRAGRIRTGTADLLAGLKEVNLPGGITGHIVPGNEHRVVVMLSGAGLSAAISDTDPGSHAVLGPTQVARPLDDTPEAARTAEALNHLLARAHRHLRAHPLNAERIERGLAPANIVLTRGAASAAGLASLPRPTHPAAVVAACPTTLGVARTLGMTPVSSSQMTGNTDTDLDHKFSQAVRMLERHAFVVVHLKATDVAAHDRRPLEKRDFIQAADAALGRCLEDPSLTGPLRVVVSADHGTSSISGKHLPHPVPLLISRWDPQSEMADFDEESAARGELGLVESHEFAGLLWARGEDPLTT